MSSDTSVWRISENPRSRSITSFLQPAARTPRGPARRGRGGRAAPRPAHVVAGSCSASSWVVPRMETAGSPGRTRTKPEREEGHHEQHGHHLDQPLRDVPHPPGSSGAAARSGRPRSLGLEHGGRHDDAGEVGRPCSGPCRRRAGPGRPTLCTLSPWAKHPVHPGGPDVVDVLGEQPVHVLGRLPGARPRRWTCGS